MQGHVRHRIGGAAFGLEGLVNPIQFDHRETL
jgi:hypothetical protein